MSDRPGLVIAAEDPRSSDARALVAALTEWMDELYQDGGEGLFRPEDCLVPRSVFVVGRIEGRAVACGALRPVNAATGEVKRMYVAPEARGRGVGQLVLEDLERRAREFGYERVILETGSLQTAAVALYDRAGFSRTAPYGPYVGDPRSVCFEKRL